MGRMAVSISLVTPSYNQARFLEETLRSVVSQRDQLHEYFVFDGGSSDGSVELIRKFANCIDYWESQRDKGQSDAIHRGFQRATGEVLGWLNSDDVLLPGALAHVRRAFEAHPEWDVVTGYHAAIDGDSKVMALHRTPRETLAKVKKGIIRVCQQTCFFRRRLYEKVGGLNLSLHCVMDHELWVRMFDAGATWGHVPHYLAGYRWHSESKGMSWDKKYAAEREWMSRTYPQYPLYHGSPVARVAYRAGMLLSGRYPMARVQTWRAAGRKLTDVFGDWAMNGPPCVRGNAR
jgi:glycosyltransferase involved in cell wall biosynthesis